MLAWHIAPRAAGFSPHRDRQPADSPGSFRDDGAAKLTTCWVPLTDATPENSCLYAIPRAHDPGYVAGVRFTVSALHRTCFARVVWLRLDGPSTRTLTLAQAWLHCSY